MDEEVYSGGLSTTRVGAKCGRWNPTAEQVKVLTDLFSSGLRTPTTEQIQMISSHLSSFGKIESKNVFYWFQNHKARERHHKKRRRRGDLCRLKGPDHKREARSCTEVGDQPGVIWDHQEKEREIETLVLFPLTTCYKLQEGGEAWRRTVRKDEWRDQMAEQDPVPLDLRLSFH